MNRTIYYRNLAIFSIMMIVIFATPFVFAETSSPTNICLDNANIQMHNRSDIDDVNGRLTSGTMIQLPRDVANNIVTDASGEINLYETRKVWHALAKQGMDKGDMRLYPPMHKASGKRLYPVKILNSNSPGISSSGKDSIGYISLSQLFMSGSFHTCRHQQQEDPIKDEPQAGSNDGDGREPSNPEPTIPPILQSSNNGSDDFFVEDSGGETTTTDGNSSAPSTSLRPTMRPERPVTQQPVTIPNTETTGDLSTPERFLNNLYNCDNTIYRRRGFANHSCLKSLSLHQRTELVMSDVLKINQLRPEFKLDPRMSACMVNRESGFNPNAQGGTPDWGMYQVIDSTANYVRRSYDHVIPDFKNLSWSAYRQKMLSSTLSQADLHHMVVFSKAEVSGSDLRSMNAAMSGNASRVDGNVIQRIARRYNGAGSAAQRYGRSIRSCYECMTGISNKNGRVTNPSRLKGCLDRAKH